MLSRRGFARLWDATRQQRRFGGFGDDYFGIWPLFGQNARDATQRAASAVSGDKVIEAFAFEGFDNFASRGGRVNIGVGLIFELTGQKPAVRFGQLHGFRHHAHAASGGWCEHDFRTEIAHQFATFNAERFSHRDDERVTLLRADHGETDTGVAAGRFDDGLTWL